MKSIKKITIILTIILVSLVSFAGIYVKKQNRMEDITKDYNLGMNLSGYRQIIIIPDLETIETEESSTDTENNTISENAENGESTENTENTVASETEQTKKELTENQVNQAKEIIEKRLKKLGATSYIVKASKENIVIQIPEDENTDYIASNIYARGKFEIIDNDTSEVLLNNSDVKNTKVSADELTSSGTTVVLSIEFDKEGKEKLAKITEDYKTVEQEKTQNETTEETASESETTEASEQENSETAEETTKNTQKQTKMQIDGNEILTQSYDEAITNGKLQLTLGQTSTDTETIENNTKSATSIATIISEGILPVDYELEENEYIYGTITNNQLFIFSTVISAIVLIAFVVFAIKYKASAILSLISYVGFVALYLLVIRYANTIVTIEGIGAILILMIINYVLVQRIIKNEEEKNAFKEFIFEAIPVLIIAVIFSFNNMQN
ncbi:MAG: hypothetical protein IJV31_11020, partial [Clostridia bacterium]|nr:hypothetical protein [Clostridia bacterium]